MSHKQSILGNIISSVLHPHVGDHQLSAKENIKVGIIGAGITGLYSAYTLQKYNIQYKILESTERIGGRILTYYFDDPKQTNQYVDLGAMRLPDSHQDVLDLAHSLHLDVQEYIMNDEEHTFFYVNKKRDPNGNIMTTKYANDHPNELGFLELKTIPVEDPDSFETILEDLKTKIDYYRFDELTLFLKKNISDDRKGRWTSVPQLYNSIYDFLALEIEALGTVNFLKNYDSYSVESYFYYIIEKWLKEDTYVLPDVSMVNNLIKNVLDYGEMTSTGSGLNHLALTEGVLDNRHFNSKVWHRIQGGMEELPKALVKELTGEISLKSTVYRIEKPDSSNERDQVSVYYYDENGDTKVEKFDRIIITAPFSTVRRWQIDPAFSFPKSQAIRSFNYDHSTKVCIKTKERFWEVNNGIHGGYSKTDLPLLTVVYPSYGYGEQEGSFITSYTWQNDAILWANMDEAQQKRLVLDNLKELHGWDPKPEDVRIHTHEWLEAFAMYGPGQYTQMLKAMMPENKVHLAGEHLSTEHAWIIGCLNSAKRAIREILVLEKKMTVQESFEKIPDRDYTQTSWDNYMRSVIAATLFGTYQQVEE